MTAPDLFERYAWGVLHLGTRTIYYERVDEWKTEERPGPLGGVMTLQLRTGRQVWRARELWAEQYLDPTPEIIAAIEADQARHVLKVSAE